MKNILLIVIIAIAGCQNFKAPTDKFIPGTYIRSSEHEFGKEYDTLILSIQNKTAKQYKIERRWRYERILDGNSIEPEYKQAVTSATYDDRQHILKETETGLEYSFEIKRGYLFAGTTKYTKIK